MRLVELRASEVAVRNTKFGEKILIVASGDLKSEIKIWRPLTDNVAQGIRANQFFTACVDSQGKYSPIATPEHAQETYTPSSYSPLATIPKPEPTPVKTPAPENTPAYDRHIENLASKIADCYRATKKQLPDLSEETIQKLATSVFIQLARDTF